MKKVITYTRVAKGDVKFAVNQLNRLEEYCEAHDLHIVKSIVKLGATNEEILLNQITDCVNEYGPIHALIVTDLDRLSRHHDTVVILKTKINDMNIEIECTESEVISQLLPVLKKAHKEEMGKRIKAGIASNKKLKMAMLRKSEPKARKVAN